MAKKTREEIIAQQRGTRLPLSPLVGNEPVMGAVRSPSLPPIGVQPGMTLAQGRGAIDPAGLDPATGTFTPGFVRSAIEQSRLESELPFQQDSAVAARQPTPDARAATLAEFSKQRLAEGSAERLQAMRSQSDIESATTRAIGNVELARQNVAGKDIKQAGDHLNNLYTQMSFMVNPGDGGTAASDKQIEAMQARIDLAQRQYDKLTGITGDDGQGLGGAGTMTSNVEGMDVQTVIARFMDANPGMDAKAAEAEARRLGRIQ